MARLNSLCTGEDKLFGTVCVLSMLSFNARKWDRERVVTHNCTRLSAQAHLLYTNTKASLKHLAIFPPRHHIHTLPTPLQHNPSSSLHFHQNIADEVLSSINHSTALLYCPPINHQAHHTVEPGLRNLSFWEWLYCHWMCIHTYTSNALAYKHLASTHSHLRLQFMALNLFREWELDLF